MHGVPEIAPLLQHSHFFARARQTIRDLRGTALSSAVRRPQVSAGALALRLPYEMVSLLRVRAGP